MFNPINNYNSSSIAAIDSLGQFITYGELFNIQSEASESLNGNSLVFILSENTIGSLMAFYSCILTGAVPLLLSRNMDSGLLNHLSSTYRPTHYWLPADYVGLNHGKYIFSKYSYTLFETGGVPIKKHPDLAFLLPTSGSTGSPKLVRHSYLNLKSSAAAVSEFFELTINDRPIAMLPMYYTMGLSIITSHLHAGATILLSNGNLMEKSFWDFIKEEKATSFTGVPFSFEILKKIRFTRMNLPDIELITQGGGKLPAELFREFAEYAKQSGRRFIATYGQTEGTARMAYLKPSLAVEKICSIGNAIPGGKLWLSDTEGNEITQNNVEGEMVYKGNNVTMGYAFNRDDLGLGDERNGVLYTGDMAYRDNDNCYFITGRLKRFLKIFGLRISLDEIEQIIMNQFGLQVVAAGTDEVLSISTTSPQLKDEIHNFIVEKTGLFHKVVNILVVDEFKRNESGKIIYET